MEGIVAWGKLQFMSLACNSSPFCNWLSCQICAFKDLDLSTSNFCSFSICLTENNFARQIIRLISDGNLRTIGDNFVILTFGIFLTDIGDRHSTVIVNLEGNVCHLKEAIWRCLFVEDIGAWSKVQFFWCCT